MPQYIGTFIKWIVSNRSVMQCEYFSAVNFFFFLMKYYRHGCIKNKIVLKNVRTTSCRTKVTITPFN